MFYLKSIATHGHSASKAIKSKGQNRISETIKNKNVSKKRTDGVINCKEFAKISVFYHMALYLQACNLQIESNNSNRQCSVKSS